MITEMNVVSENAKQVIEILTTNMPNVFGAVGIKHYTNKYGEISNVSVNVGTNFPKKKAEDMREELKQISSFTRGPSAWEELLRTEADIRKRRKQAIYNQKERQRQIIEIIGVIVLVLVISGFLFGLGWIYYQNRGGGIY